jgi:hypothetical protein
MSHNYEPHLGGGFEMIANGTWDKLRTVSWAGFTSGPALWVALKYVKVPEHLLSLVLCLLLLVIRYALPILFDPKQSPLSFIDFSERLS